MKGNTAIAAGGVPERNRVENVINMFKAGELGDPNSPNLRVFPLVCKAFVALESDAKVLLEELRQRSWVALAETHPKVGDEILTRFEDEAGLHVEFMEWTEEDGEFFSNEAESNDIYWMRLPPI